MAVIAPTEPLCADSNPGEYRSPLFSLSFFRGLGSLLPSSLTIIPQIHYIAVPVRLNSVLPSTHVSPVLVITFSSNALQRSTLVHQHGHELVAVMQLSACCFMFSVVDLLTTTLSVLTIR